MIANSTNIPAVLTSLGGTDFDRICNALTDMGYLYGVMVIDAALFVPQSRERLFILAVDGALDLPALHHRPIAPPGLPYGGSRQGASPSEGPTDLVACPVPPPHNSLTLVDILDDRGMTWDAPAKYPAEILRHDGQAPP